MRLSAKGEYAIKALLDLADSGWQIWALFGVYGLYYAATEGVAKALVADLVEAPVSQIRELNPALLKDVAPAGALRVPKGAGTALALLETIPAEKRLAWRAHRVADGNTF